MALEIKSVFLLLKETKVGQMRALGNRAYKVLLLVRMIVHSLD